MQKNTIIAVVILIAVAVAGYFFLTKYPMPGQGDVAGEESQEIPSNDRALAGPVTAIDLEGAMVDGPYRFTIMTSANEMVEIAIPSMGIMLCAAKDSIADVNSITIGQTIEVRGTVGEGGIIIPCESAEHYFRVAVDQKG